VSENRLFGGVLIFMGLFETIFEFSVKFFVLVGLFTWREYKFTEFFFGANHRYSMENSLQQQSNTIALYTN
jgi:hypothetical protein